MTKSDETKKELSINRVENLKTSEYQNCEYLHKVQLNNRKRKGDQTHSINCQLKVKPKDINKENLTVSS